MRRYLAVTLLIGFGLMGGGLQAQIFNGPVSGIGAPVVGMGNAYTAVDGSVWSAFHNPAGILHTDGVELGSFVEQRFQLAELAFASVGAAIPLAANQGLGVSVSSMGFAGFRESMLGLSYGIAFFDKLSLGSRINFANVNIPTYGSASVFFVDVGLQYQFNPQLRLGASMININQARLINNFGETSDLPTVLSLGLAYQPIKEVRLLIDAVKDVNFPLSFRGGLEYAFSDNFYARIGAGTQAVFLSGGIGIAWKALKVDFALSYTEFVQYSPHFSVSYLFGKKAGG